jgi:hypothetical protein
MRSIMPVIRTGGLQTSLSRENLLRSSLSTPKRGQQEKKLQLSALLSSMMLDTRSSKCSLCGGGGKMGLLPGPHSL